MIVVVVVVMVVVLMMLGRVAVISERCIKINGSMCLILLHLVRKIPVPHTK